MILADTSVWVNHFRGTDQRLEEFLLNDRILTHPFIIGEIACGNLGKRAEILSSLRQLPHATTASHDEVLHLIELHRLWGRGIGWIDAHLLASALLTGCRLLTAERRLHGLATELKVSF